MSKANTDGASGNSDPPVYHAVELADHSKAIPNSYIVSIHDSLNMDAHVQELKGVIEAEKASNAARGHSDSEPVQSARDVRVMKAVGMYSGTFSPGVLDWIRRNKDVKLVEQDIIVSLD